MVMSEIDPEFVKASVKLCKALQGKERTEFIEDALVDYKWTAYVKSPSCLLYTSDAADE